MNAEGVVQQIGRLWGFCITSQGLRYLDWRCARFQLHVTGSEHLQEATRRPALVVANHIFHRPQDAPMGVWTRSRLLKIFNWPADSFIFRRILAEEAGLRLRVVAKCDRGWWSHRPLLFLLQKRVGQPFMKGILSGLGYLPIEHNSGCFHRAFFQSVAAAADKGDPILIFPGRISTNGTKCVDTILDPDVAAATWGPSEPCVLPGASHLARKFGLWVVPAYTSGGDSWRPGQEAHVHFGEGFSAAGMSKEQISAEMVARIRVLAAEARQETSQERARPEAALPQEKEEHVASV